MLFSREAYESHLHGIDGVDQAVVGERCLCMNTKAANVTTGDVITRKDQTRVSLTFRFVPESSEATPEEAHTGSPPNAV